jgi:hypothetical protein
MPSPPNLDRGPTARGNATLHHFGLALIDYTTIQSADRRAKPPQGGRMWRAAAPARCLMNKSNALIFGTLADRDTISSLRAYFWCVRVVVIALTMVARFD